MANINIPPTRSNLLRMKQELRFAREGYEILDRKREVLTTELIQMAHDAQVVQDEISKLVAEAYRALEQAAPTKVKIETIGKSDEGRELVIVWISSEANIRNLQRNRDNLARIADPRGMSETQVNQLIANTKPHYHLMGGLHSGEVGPSEMLMELAYRLVAETSPLINQIRDNVYVSITPQADPDGRDRNVDFGCARAIKGAGQPAVE